METRLNKFLSEAGICSRREADFLIEKGEIIVNGKPATLGQKVDPATDQISYQGKPVFLNEKLVYYALYKPVKVVSTTDDPAHRSKITDYVPAAPRVYPVGRLDYDSEGLIILTNDGELTNTLTHPSFEHEKEYEIKIKNQKLKIKNADEIKKLFESGLMIEGHLMKADHAGIVKDKALSSGLLILRLVLHTGYNRQIRKMCDKIGLKVDQLIRIRIGKLSLNSLNLKPGEYKVISRIDIL